MELVIEPDVYSPNIDDNGNYIDKIPSFNIIKNGIYCSCGTRKDKIYKSNSVFSQHTKTKMHQKWLSDLNTNRANYYVENEKLREVIQNQKYIIAKLEKDVNNKSMTIDYLTQQINNYSKITSIGNLLDMDV